MQKSGAGKSTARKPLADISNGGKPSRPCLRKIPTSGDDNALDSLLLVRSDLSNLFNQIDKVVAQAFELKRISKAGSQDIQSFRQFLADMHSSLKPWVPRLQQAFTSTTITSANLLGQSLDTNPVSVANELSVVPSNQIASNQIESEPDMIVSPSALVSWRAGSCTVESGRQLFLLTPLPKSKVLSSKRPGSSKSMVGKLNDKDPQHRTIGLPPLSSISRNDHADLLERVEKKLEPAKLSDPHTVEATSTSESGIVSPFQFPNNKSKDNSFYLLTPCLKRSPPKTCTLIDPVAQTIQQDARNIPKPTPWACRNQNRNEPDDPSSEEVSESLASKYPEFFGFHPAHNLISRRKEVDETLDWFLSPPKTCVLMEPSDEKQLPIQANGFLLSTPMWKEFETTIQKGKQPGENTLKRELWTKFEAVSTDGLPLDVSAFPKPAKKGFLDMLEEVSCEPTGLESRVAR